MKAVLDVSQKTTWLDIMTEVHIALVKVVVILKVQKDKLLGLKKNVRRFN